EVPGPDGGDVGAQAEIADRLLHRVHLAVGERQRQSPDVTDPAGVRQLRGQYPHRVEAEVELPVERPYVGRQPGGQAFGLGDEIHIRMVGGDLGGRGQVLAAVGPDHVVAVGDVV